MTRPRQFNGDGVGLVCPHCARASSKVVETRPHRGRIFRRRHCPCGEDYTTVEVNIERSIRELLKPEEYRRDQ